LPQTAAKRAAAAKHAATERRQRGPTHRMSALPEEVAPRHRQPVVRQRVLAIREGSVRTNADGR
jgi:hypothetical protein